MKRESTVLLVENNTETREVYATFLRHHGFDVLEAATGLDGLEAARTQTPAIIIMNVAMPGVDGLSVAYALKADPATASIPIILCTAFDRDEGKSSAELAGCDSYLEKPCAPSRLLEEVRRFTGTAVAGGA